MVRHRQLRQDPDRSGLTRHDIVYAKASGYADSNESEDILNLSHFLETLIATFIAMIFAMSGCNCEISGSAEGVGVDKASAVVECRISLDLGGGIAAELRLTDANLIKDLFLEPLRKARPDPERTKYKVLGSVSVKKKDGSEESFVLFRPWGRIQGEKLLIVDLSGLRKLLKESLSQAADLL